MKDMRSILRLTCEQGLSIRAVPERLKPSKTTVCVIERCITDLVPLANRMILYVEAFPDRRLHGLSSLSPSRG